MAKKPDASSGGAAILVVAGLLAAAGGAPASRPHRGEQSPTGAWTRQRAVS